MNLITLTLSILLVGLSPAGSQSTAAPQPKSAEAPPAKPPAAPAASQTAPPATRQAAPVPGVQAAPYRIGPDDEINLVVVGEEQLTKLFHVQADGGISLPYVGTVIAQGLTSLELQERIRVALKDWIRDPQVRAEVSKYGSQYVMVGGEVRDPQRVPMTGPMTVMEALVAAGSETAAAGTQATIARKNPNGSGDALIIPVNLADLKRGVAGANIALVGGDIINVAKAELFYVQGRVKSVGNYTWEPGLTVDQAITKAGGIDDRGSNRGIKVTRVEKGRSRTFEVKLTDLVLANDTVIVPARMF